MGEYRESSEDITDPGVLVAVSDPPSGPLFSNSLFLFLFVSASPAQRTIVSADNP